MLRASAGLSTWVETTEVGEVTEKSETRSRRDAELFGDLDSGQYGVAETRSYLGILIRGNSGAFVARPLDERSRLCSVPPRLCVLLFSVTSPTSVVSIRIAARPWDRPSTRGALGGSRRARRRRS